MASNPTVTELLWLDSYTAQTPEGRDLVANRHRFLSRRARNTYGGYARQQAERLVRRGGSFSSDTSRRTAKHGRHCARLLIQGRHLAEYGEVLVRLSPAGAATCFAAGDRAVADPAAYREWVAAEVTDLDECFDRSDLPDAPEAGWADEFLFDLRADDLRRAAP